MTITLLHCTFLFARHTHRIVDAVVVQYVQKPPVLFSLCNIMKNVLPLVFIKLTKCWFCVLHIHHAPNISNAKHRKYLWAY